MKKHKKRKSRKKREARFYRGYLNASADDAKSPSLCFYVTFLVQKLRHGLILSSGNLAPPLLNV